MKSDEGDRLIEAEKLLMQQLEKHKNGISVKNGISTILPTLTQEQRMEVVNKVLQSRKAEVCTIGGFDDSILRHRKSKLPTTATQEDELVYSLVEESGEAGTLVREMRGKSGLTEAVIKRVLKGLEKQLFVKSLKAPGMTQKSYFVYELEPDEKATGGTFYSGQEFDSKFVCDLLGVCVKMLQKVSEEAADQFPMDMRAQLEASFVKPEVVGKFIYDKQVSKVQLTTSDVESLLEVGIIEGKVEKDRNNKYRALNKPIFVSPLVSMPCYYCPMRNECAPGHRISPESCIYIKNCFEL